MRPKVLIVLGLMLCALAAVRLVSAADCGTHAKFNAALHPTPALATYDVSCDAPAAPTVGHPDNPLCDCEDCVCDPCTCGIVRGEERSIVVGSYRAYGFRRGQPVRNTGRFLLRATGVANGNREPFFDGTGWRPGKIVGKVLRNAKHRMNARQAHRAARRAR